jgi:hypothetical protein
MNYSTNHKEFALNLNDYYNINEQDVLDHPENYLGPNYKEVLNLFFYCDSLSCESLRVYWDRVNSLEYETLNKACSTAIELAKEVIDQKIFYDFVAFIVLELIASHLFIERGIPFTYLPLIFDL